MNEGETRQDAFKRGERKREKEDRKARRQEVKKETDSFEEELFWSWCNNAFGNTSVWERKITHHFSPKFAEVCGWQPEYSIRGHFMF